MTGPSRGLPHPLLEAHGRAVSATSASTATSTSTSTEDCAPRGRRRRQSGALERRLSHVTDVEEASRLVECSQIQRQLHFQQLVRRYMSQILYGCTNAHCTTTTCLSCKRRLPSRPFRAPTQLTARALAHFLASQDDPHAGLCPNQPNVSASALEIEGVDGIAITREEGRKETICNVYPVVRPLFHTSISGPEAPNSSTAGAHHIQPVRERTGKALKEERTNPVWAALDTRHQAKKDVRSLGQNLYDTVAVIYSYSKQIPSALSVFSSLRALHSPRPNDTRNHDSRSPSVNGLSTDTSKPDPLGHANGHAVLPHVNGNPTPGHVTSKNLPRSNMSRHRSSSQNMSQEILRNGRRIHRIHHQPEHVPNGQAVLKSQDTGAFGDGNRERLLAHSPKMKQKPLSLVQNGAPKIDPTNVTPLSARQDEGKATPSESSRTSSESSGRPVLPVASYLDCQIMDQLKDEVYHHRNQQSSDFNFVVDYDTNARFRPAKPFVNRSIFFTLSDPDTLLQSFYSPDNGAYQTSPLPHLDSTRLAHTFRDWNRRNGALIFDSLWIAVKALFVPPPELDVQKSPRLKAALRSPSLTGTTPDPPATPKSEEASGRFISDEEAAHIVMICVHALTSLVPVGWPHSWVQVRKFRSWGIILPDAPPHTDFTDGFADPVLSTIDELEYEPALRLADRLVRGIGARLCFEEILVNLGHQKKDNRFFQRCCPGLIPTLVGHLIEVERIAVENKRRMKTKLNYDEDPGWTVTATFMEWLRTIVIKKWDGKAEVNRWTSVGAAIRILQEFYDNRELLNLRTSMFHMPYINEHIDNVDEPMKFLERNRTINTFHLLEYPFLFTSRDLVAHFRTMNFTRMYKEFEQTDRAVHLQREMDPFLREPYWWLIRSRLKVTFTDYFVLDIRRKHALEDTLNQLWGQEKRLLMKPLKVKMGQQEGEVGLDQGGVTYEFFRVVMSDAFDPDKGMFTIDPSTRMTWFHPATVEPARKFEMLGILFSLAVYNGITLPVTFPLCFYNYLLHGPPQALMVTNDIRDGWPELAKSLDQMISWEDGDVGDVFMRSYTFSYDAFGANVDFDILGYWHPRYTEDGVLEPHEPPMVTNANRKEFVQNYIYWLTTGSVLPQLDAFRNGFLTCLHPTSLELFEPSSLRALIEGSQEVSISALKAVTHYEEGYNATHATIVDFWSVVETYSNDDRKKLLEFVTASDRVPVTGFETMSFSIVRNGGESDMLPTSSTCFGKLMLPQYADKEKLRTKLGLAIQNCKGFGVV
ncbi:hypothetical protein BCR34DRAFT_482063 [Clohesyomyces aquaticus]|uniref:HECT-type E3 ubiquitin transferase n=1 Tax=Clohesyomyces aquaticus TaxID=1231657 RepID=A0A1Y1ZS96_9PLEO|nr:hypothetical protein BCR34DRAFT_482063 [Clohesyomyces aquaticus]